MKMISEQGSTIFDLRREIDWSISKSNT